MELGDGVGMTDSKGHSYIVSARETSEERRAYAQRHQEGGRGNARTQAQHSAYSGGMAMQIDAIT